MSNKNGFASGLIAGIAFGGLVGGLFGVLIGSRISDDTEAENLLDSQDTEKQISTKEAEAIEETRQNLEGKIAKLNQVIDEVRQQISSVNGTWEKSERSPSE